MRLYICLGLIVVFSPHVEATELVYRFTDPSFGGNPLNGNFLMSQAIEQNNFKEKVMPDAPVNALQDFTDRLKNSILSGLARAASGNLIDATTGKIIPNNSVIIGDFSVVVGSEIDGGVSISVSDGISSTHLIVPSINSQ